MRRALAIILAAVVAAAPLAGRAEEPVTLKFSRAEIEAKWQARIRALLAAGVIPLIDMLSFLPRDDADDVVGWTMREMDAAGVALMSLGGYPAPKGGKAGKYIWGYTIHEVVNAHPDRFILATNKGSNRNWWAEKGGGKNDYIDQLESQVRGGDYPIMAQIEFRHYPSSAQCKRGKSHRDIDIPIDGDNGRRVFRLSAETGVAFGIHLEPEDGPLAGLERMLAAYPKAKVIYTHFGQVRRPEKARRFGPALVRRLLAAYPNLYFDISTGEPGRRYACGDRPLDTVIWQADDGGQKDVLAPAYKAILEDFSGRFVSGLDYGPANRNSAAFFRQRVANVRLILRDLSDRAKHDIGYRTAWKLLTGRTWQ